MTIYMASDHAGFELKEAIKTHLVEEGYTIEDCGTDNKDSVNWVEYGARAARNVSESPDDRRGIIICGSGIGMSMVSNKFKHVRAALCNDKYSAEMSRRHNNANVLNLGARILKTETALQIVDLWLSTPFDGGRHQTRLNHLNEVIENQNFK